LPRVDKSCELNGKASILYFAFEKKDPLWEMESLGYPSADCSNFSVLFADANLKY